jgi:hypothetical protein
MRVFHSKYLPCVHELYTRIEENAQGDEGETLYALMDYCPHPFQVMRLNDPECRRCTPVAKTDEAKVTMFMSPRRGLSA